MRFKLAIQGNLKKHIEENIRAGEKAITGAMKDARDGMKADLRGMTSTALGPRMAKTWRGEVFPRTGESMSAAAWVYSKAPSIVRAFNEGSIIRSGSGFWLAIPTPEAPRRGVGGGRISPSNWPTHRYGPLRFVYRRSHGLLVVDNLRQSISRKTGQARGFRKASATGVAAGRVATVIMFILVRQVKMPKRLDVKQVAEDWQGRLPALIIKNWPET